MALAVRAVVPDDWRVLREVRLAALLDAPYAFYATFEQTAARAEEEWRTWPRQGVAFLAWLGGEPVGMVGVAASTSPGLSGDLIAMWVAPAARGTGAADALVQAAQDWAREQGWTMLDLEVAPGTSGLAGSTPGTALSRSVRLPTSPTASRCAAPCDPSPRPAPPRPRPARTPFLTGWSALNPSKTPFLRVWFVDHDS